MTPSQRNAIIEKVRQINDGHGGCTPSMIGPYIKGMGYDDPGRELRRLKEAGKLESWEMGIYYAPNRIKVQSLGRWG